MMLNQLSYSQGSNTAIKVVSVPTGPDSAGLPATTLLFDETSGAVKAMVNASGLTGIRTA